jgi:cytochrome oxidase Cu insertion factor (SCO1/SenC/PrrC family)
MVGIFSHRGFGGAASMLLAMLAVSGCAVRSSGTAPSPEIVGQSARPIAAASATAPRPGWLDIELTEVTSGGTFTIGGFAGKVVLLEAMATWCPTCRQQGNEVKKLRQALGSSDQLVSVSIDVDPNEDAALLVKYASGSSFDWRFAIAPTQLGRDLADLYGPEFLNPPYAPMLIVDRDGGVHPLPDYLKTADQLQADLAPYLGA